MEKTGDPGPENAEVTFWREYLAGASTVLELPSDHRRPGQPSYRGTSQEFVLRPELITGLRELSRQEQVAPRTTITAAFATLLYRYTGQEDLLVGLTVPRSEGASRQLTVGPSANTVVLRVDLAGQPSVRQLLNRTQAASEAIRSHGAIPFDAVVEEMLPELSPSHHPLVQVLLTFRSNVPGRSVGGALAPTDSHRQTCEVDLCLELDCLDLDERPGGATGLLTYNSDLFESETITRMIEHLRMVLAGMVAKPGRPVGELPLLAPLETKQLLGEWSAGGEVMAGPDIAELIAEQARVRPGAAAVVCEGERLTYRELNGRANQLARYLREQGVKPEVPVGVCLARSPDHVIALVGILKAGGAYVPLDPEAPADRIRYVLEDSQMPLVLTQRRLRKGVSGTGAQVVSLDESWDVIEQHGQEELDGESRPDQLGYVIYTSGSTGHPKGVMVERGSLSAHSRAMIAEYALGPQDRVLQFSQYSADASLEQILPTLAVGGRLVMRGTEIWTPWQLLEVLKSEHVTVMNLSPVHWYQAVREWTRTSQGLEGIQLRLVILGGERLATQAVRQWRDLGLSGVRLLNAYGPTETTITATLGEVGKEEPITIGRPLAGRRV
jgi:amino acid adenylation domain-containing protein